MKNFISRGIVMPGCLMLAVGIVAFADDNLQNGSHKTTTAELLKKLTHDDSPTVTFGWQGKKNGEFQSPNLFFTQNSAGKYWIGVQCSPISSDLRSQLGLEKGIGLVVQSVSADSPASKSNLKKHDVLVKFGENNLKTIGDLTKAIQKTDGKKIKIVVIRKGKKQTITIKPAKRKGFGNLFISPQFTPQWEFTPHWGENSFFKNLGDGKFELKFDKKQMEEMKKRFQSKDFNKDFNMKFFGPGVVMPFGKDANFKSSNSSIMIRKTNNGKAKIRIQKNGKTWETTEDELDKLPKDIRKEVEQALKNTKTRNGGGFQFHIDGKNFPKNQMKGTNIPGFSNNNMSIMMNQTNGGKTKIKVMQNGKSWEVTEDELDKLPKEIRRKVKAALKNKINFPKGKFGGNLFSRKKRSGSNDDNFQKKVDDLNRQVEELQKALENLKKKKRRKPVSQDIV